MTGDCCVFKELLLPSVDGEHLMRFQSEILVFKFLHRIVSTGSEKLKRHQSTGTKRDSGQNQPLAA